MDDLEFDILDELYFVTSYEDLEQNLDIEVKSLKQALSDLASKKWIRVYRSFDEEIEDFDIEKNFRSYYYLASKSGLMAHNRQ